MSNQTETDEIKYAIHIENACNDNGGEYFDLPNFNEDAMPGARWAAVCKALEQSGWPVGVGDIIKVVPKHD